jgi:hypothetical protein
MGLPGAERLQSKAPSDGHHGGRYKQMVRFGLAATPAPRRGKVSLDDRKASATADFRSWGPRSASNRPMEFVFWTEWRRDDSPSTNDKPVCPYWNWLTLELIISFGNSRPRSVADKSTIIGANVSNHWLA